MLCTIIKSDHVFHSCDLCGSDELDNAANQDYIYFANKKFVTIQPQI